MSKKGAAAAAAAAAKPAKGNRGLRAAVAVVVLAAAFYAFTTTSAARTFPLGNLLQTPGFRLEDMPSLKGKTAVVTGANSGTGKESVFWLAKSGSHVIATCRSQKVCDEAIADMRARAGPDTQLSIEVGILDLSSLASVKAFADSLAGRDIHILMLNAGVMASPYTLTKDGIEQQFGVNHVAHQYLTTLLMANLEKSAPSRIISVASSAHNMSPLIPNPITIDFINNETTYSPFTQYGLSKMSNILMTRKLARMVADKAIYANVIHPGFVFTSLARHVAGTPLTETIFNTLASIVAYDVTRGSITQLYAAASPEIETKNLRGAYLVPLAVQDTPRSDALLDDVADRLWDFTEELIRSKVAPQQKEEA